MAASGVVICPGCFLLPLHSQNLLLGMLGTELSEESPILHVAASYSLEPWCQCLAEQVRSRGLLAAIHHIQRTKGCLGDALEKAELLQLRFPVRSACR